MISGFYSSGYFRLSGLFMDNSKDSLWKGAPFWNADAYGLVLCTQCQGQFDFWGCNFPKL